MGSRDPRVDTYIEKSAEFARPILRHLRETVHAACPEAEETLRWSMPHFMYGGTLLCGMAAFKGHAAFGFRKGSLVVPDGAERDGMGQFGCLRAVSDLPPRKVMIGHVKRAMEVTDRGVESPRSRDARSKPAPRVPADLAAALKMNRRAGAAFAKMPPSHKREYIEWLTEAKRPETRQRRLRQATTWLAEGKPRNWKYQSH